MNDTNGTLREGLHDQVDLVEVIMEHINELERAVKDNHGLTTKE